MRGEPYYYDEVKGNISLTITNHARQRFEELALANDLSKSEFLERLLRQDPTVIKSLLKNEG